MPLRGPSRGCAPDRREAQQPKGGHADDRAEDESPAHSAGRLSAHIGPLDKSPPSRDSGFVQSRSTSSRLSWFLPPPLLHSCRWRRKNSAVSSASPISYADRQRPALRSFATHPGAIAVIHLSTISTMVVLVLMCLRRSDRRRKVRPGLTSSTCEGAERS
jgi:hypothetical protein